MPAIRNPPPPKKKSHSRAHPPGYIPRPRNAFFIFRSAFYKSHKEDDDDSKINQQDLSKQVAIIWNEMNEDEREPFVLQAEEEKRRHAEMYPGYIYAPNGTNGKAKGKAKSKSSSTRRKAKGDDDDAYTISSSRPRRRVVTTPATPPASSPSSNYSPRITPGADSFPASEYQWQQSPQHHLRSLLDSPFDSSSPSPLPSPETLVLPSPLAYEPRSLLPSPVREVPACGLRLQEAPVPDCPGPLQLHYSYPSPPVSPGSSTGATTAGSVIDPNERPWWPAQRRAAYGSHDLVSANAVPCQPQHGSYPDQRLQAPPSLVYHDNIIDGLGDYLFPNDSAATIDDLIKLNLPPIPAFDETLAGAGQEFAPNLASAEGNAAFPQPPPLIFDFNSLALNAGLPDAPAKGAASSQALPVEDNACGVNSPTGTSSNDDMSPNLISPLLLSNPILEEACLAREMALDDMFRRFIDLEGAAT